MLFRSSHASTVLLCAVSLPLNRVSWAQDAAQDAYASPAAEPDEATQASEKPEADASAPGGPSAGDPHDPGSEEGTAPPAPAAREEQQAAPTSPEAQPAAPPAAKPQSAAAPAPAPRPTEERSTEPAQEGDDDQVKLVPFRHDLVGDHFQAGATVSFAFPFGSVSRGTAVRERSGWGGGGAIDLTYGLDRFVALGAYVKMSEYGDSGRCDGCSATTLGSGAFVRYHLSQGLKLDPWVSYGVGFLTYGSESSGTVFHHSGLEWMRLQVGANWYATPNFIVGPVLGLSAAHMLERPPEEELGGPLMLATVGLRIAFDTPGR